VLDLNDLACFVRVVERGGFSAAARALGMPKSTLSERIARLEGELGARLLERSSRRFAVTDAGRELHRHASAMLIHAESAEHAVRGRTAQPRGAVRLTCAVGMAADLAPLLAQFLARYPEVELVQQATNRFVDLVAEGFDLGLRGHAAPMPDSDLIQRRIARTPWLLVAAPAYLEAHGEPAQPAQLAEHRRLVVPDRTGESAWTLHGPGGTARIGGAPRLASDDLETLKAAALAGLGVAALPAQLCRAERAAGRLRPLLPGWSTGDAQITLLAVARRTELPAVRALADFLIAEYPRALAADAAADAGGGERA
jgi:DNA-binding transcriptional LysR family regulator